MKKTAMLRAAAGSAGGGGGFAPDDIAGLFGWYDASTLGLADGTAVDSWTDLSGEANHLVGAADARPTLETNVQNGLSVVRFDGSDDYVECTGIDSITQPITVFVVIDAIEAGAQRCVYDSIDTTASHFSVDERAGQGLYLRAGANLKVDDAVIDAWAVYTLTHNGASSSIRKNGSEVAAGDAGSNALTDLRVGKGGSATFAGVFAGDMGELVFYDALVESTDRDSVETYLMDKWL